MNAKNPEAASKPFIITRVFDAPRELVFKVWTDPHHLMQWFGPKGTSIPVCKVDLRPGGIAHYCMRMPDGNEMWGMWTFLEITPPEKLVLISSFSDAQGGKIRHPLAETWPLETLSTSTFVEEKGQTTLTITSSPYNASESEITTFNQAHPGMEQGWGGTFEQLRAYLEAIQGKKTE